MFAQTNRFYVDEAYEDEFLATFEDSMELLAERDGFVRFHLLTPADDETDPYVSITLWESRDDFEAWTNSDAFEESHSGETPDGMFLGPPELETHDVVATREP
jgi:heme-degrading monooxygenase HmoA